MYCIYRGKHLNRIKLHQKSQKALELELYTPLRDITRNKSTATENPKKR
jgi:hypothetical protein